MNPKMKLSWGLSYQQKIRVRYGSCTKLGLVSLNFGPIRVKSNNLIFFKQFQTFIMNLELKILHFDCSLEGPIFDETIPNLVYGPQFSLVKV